MAENPEPFAGRPHAPEWAPSALTAEEPTPARALGMTGWAITLVGALALVLNLYTDTPRLIGPGLGAALVVIGLGATLYHASRDADPMVRRLYLTLGVCLLA